MKSLPALFGSLKVESYTTRQKFGGQRSATWQLVALAQGAMFFLSFGMLWM